MTDRPLRVGDVCLDLAQGRPVQIVSDPQQTAGEWSESNNYNLMENYGNSRLGTTEEDAVFDCVYVGSLQSEPSKTYAFPEARLGRIEVESSDESINSIQEEFIFDLLVAMVREADGSGRVPALTSVLNGVLDEETVGAALELGTDGQRTLEAHDD